MGAFLWPALIAALRVALFCVLYVSTQSVSAWSVGSWAPGVFAAGGPAKAEHCQTAALITAKLRR